MSDAQTWGVGRSAQPAQKLALFVGESRIYLSPEEADRMADRLKREARMVRKEAAE